MSETHHITHSNFNIFLQINGILLFTMCITNFDLFCYILLTTHFEYFLVIRKIIIFFYFKTKHKMESIMKSSEMKFKNSEK